MFDTIRSFLHHLYDVEGLIRSAGPHVPLLICIIVFIETGFFVGFLLPGDSLLVTAGVFSAAGVVPVKWLLFPVMLCAIAGDQVGYWIGRAAGSALYRREDSFFFKKKHLKRAHEFYEKHGSAAIIIARFIPIVRTFCPPVAGAAEMPYARYFLFDIMGGVLWIGSMVLGGYFLGRSIPNISQRIHYVIAAVIVLSLLPAVISIWRAKQAADDPDDAVTVPEEN